MKDQQAVKPSLLVEEAQATYLERPDECVARILAGLPVEEFDSLRELLGLTVEEMARKVGISTATLSRRRARKQPLDRDHSDRLLRFARLFWLSAHLYDGDLTAARRWLSRPEQALAGQSPLEFAETEMGAREVEDLIGRIEYSVYT